MLYSENTLILPKINFNQMKATTPLSKQLFSFNSLLTYFILLLVQYPLHIKAQYCTATSFCSEYINNVTINTINKNSSCNSGYENYTTDSTIVWMDNTYALSVTVGSQQFTTLTNVWVDWNNNQSFADPGEQLFIPSFSTVTGTINVTVPYTGVNGNVRMRVRTSRNSVTACGALTWGECEDYNLFLAGAIGCSGTPAPATTVASANPACYGQNFTLSLNTSYIDTNITYQWQASTDSVTWTNIAGATALNYTGAQTAATYYRCQVNCTNGGVSVYSTILYVTMNLFTNCYCIPGSTNNTNGQEIINVTFAGINNSTGATGTQGYANFTSLPGANVTQSDSFPLSVTLYSGTFNWGAAWIDWNQNGLYEISEFIDMGMGGYPIVLSHYIMVPGNAVSGTTHMRVRVRNYQLQASAACSGYPWGETEDYSVNVSLCTHPPLTPGIIAGLDTVCEGSGNIYSIMPVNSAAYYSWTLPAGWTGASLTTSIVAVSNATSGTIAITADNACGSNLPQMMTITVNSLPVVSLAPFMGVCDNILSFPLTGGNPSGGTYSGTGVTVNNFNPVTVGPGVYLISYTYTDLNYCSATDTASIQVNVCTNVPEPLTNKEVVTIYPIPFSTELTIRLEKQYWKRVMIEIKNILDQTVLHLEEINTGKHFTKVMDVGFLSKGVYFAEIMVDGELMVKMRLLK